MRTEVFIGIGSNLGDRLAHCRQALDRLGRMPRTRLRKTSPFFETDPREGVEGGRFLNGVAQIATELSPRELLDSLHQIEVALGRERTHSPGSARSVDLDILLYGDVMLEEPDLVIPHPRMADRRFVLAPLVTIAPAVRHPVLKVTAETLLRRLGAGEPAPPLGVSG